MLPDDDEMNQVFGGGIMKGSLILLGGGDPGVGRSILALQVPIQISSQLSTPWVGIGMGPILSSSTGNDKIVGPVWYVSGGKTLEQIATRAQLLNEPPKFEDNNLDGINKNHAYMTAMTTKLPDQLFLLLETNINVLANQVVQLWMKQQQQQQILQNNDELGGPLSLLPPNLIVINLRIQTMVCEGGGSSSMGGVSQV
jgi:predicted ATP-dependent serine protease